MNTANLPPAYPPTVDVPGAANLLKVHPKTVLDLIDEGAFPAAKVGRAYVMFTQDVLNYLTQLLAHQTLTRMKRPATTSRRTGPSRAGSRNA
ncbi:MAG: helix-turn-helix domain-containing protein [Burkholderiaceae bacterium]